MKSNDTSHFSWPVRELPVLRVAGPFPMLVPDCNRIYRNETVALHLHDYRGEMWIGKRHMQLQPGDLTISPARGTSRYRLAESGTHLCLHFQLAVRSPIQDQVKLPIHFRLGTRAVAAKERIWRIIDHLRLAGGKTKAAAAGAASASLLELLLWLHLEARRGTGPRRGSLADEALAKLDRAIDASLDRPMLIGELAAHVGLSAEYVARLFVQRNGITLQHFLLLRRIELARHLLVSSDLRVSEIARRVGIPDPQYFNKQFRRVAGQSPLAYREAAG